MIMRRRDLFFEVKTHASRKGCCNRNEWRMLLGVSLSLFIYERGFSKMNRIITLSRTHFEDGFIIVLCGLMKYICDFVKSIK